MARLISLVIGPTVGSPNNWSVSATDLLGWSDDATVDLVPFDASTYSDTYSDTY